MKQSLVAFFLLGSAVFGASLSWASGAVEFRKESEVVDCRPLRDQVCTTTYSNGEGFCLAEHRRHAKTFHANVVVPGKVNSCHCANGFTPGWPSAGSR